MFSQVVPVRNSHSFFKNYSYLVVGHNRTAIFVDPSWEFDKCTAAIHEADVSLAGILITHAHLDHTYSAERLSDLYNCPIWMSHEEITASGYQPSRMAAIDETPWTVGGMRIEPIATPGHTVGSMCFHIGAHVFTGDTLFTEGCGMCPNVDAAHRMFESLTKLRRRLSLGTKVFPGHRYAKPPGQTIHQVIEDNIYLHFQDKESFAAFRLRPGQTPAKLYAFK